MKPSESKLIQIGRDHVEQLAGVRELLAKYPNQLSFGGQGQGEGRFRVGLYLDEGQRLSLDELRKISTTGTTGAKEEEMPLMAICDLDRTSGAVLETKVLRS